MSPYGKTAPQWDFTIERTPESPKLVIDLPTRVDSVPKRRRRIRDRGVSFADEALLYSNDWTEQEVQTSWYTKDELAEFKGERKELVRMLKKVAFDLDAVDRETYCLRGFEAYFSIEINKATKYARELIATAVFSEQNRQRSEGIFDMEMIRRASMKTSQWTLRNALILGSKDAAEVRAAIMRERELNSQRFFSPNNRICSEMQPTASLCLGLRNASLSTS